jgi:hypothetical protein
MDKNKLIENIKNQLKSLMSSEVKFAEIKAGDLMISSPDEELMIGSEVFTVDQDGNNIPLVDGDYTLDTGEKIMVVSGKVEAMVNAEVVDSPEAVENGEMKPEKVEVKKEEVDEEVEVEDEDEDEEVDEMKKDYMAKIEERLAKCEKMLEEMGQANNKMAQELSAVADLPAAKSISVEPSEFKSVEDKKSGVGAVDIMAIREKARRGR